MVLQVAMRAFAVLLSVVVIVPDDFIASCKVADSVRIRFCVNLYLFIDWPCQVSTNIVPENCLSDGILETLSGNKVTTCAWNLELSLYRISFVRLLSVIMRDPLKLVVTTRSL